MVRYTLWERMLPWLIGIGAFLLLLWGYLKMLFSPKPNISGPAADMIPWFFQTLGIIGAPILVPVLFVLAIILFVMARREQDKFKTGRFKMWALIAAILCVLLFIYGVLMWILFLIPK